jgi:hypothetical protein
MTDNPFRIPTDAEIVDAESRLNFRFPNQYIRLLKGGSNVANAAFEPAVIFLGGAATWIFSLKITATTSAYRRLVLFDTGRTTEAQTKVGQPLPPGSNRSA